MVAIDGEPWFVAADVCRCLDLYISTNGYPNVAMVKRLVQADETTLNRIESSVRSVRLISESGLYKLVMRSDKPEAKAFQDWVTRVVLPAIRKDGGYILGEEKAFSGEMPEDELMARALVGERRPCDTHRRSTFRPLAGCPWRASAGR